MYIRRLCSNICSKFNNTVFNAVFTKRSVKFSGRNLMIAALAVLCINSVSLTASADFCAGLGSEFGDFIECSEEFTTFSKFQGGLEAPETQGYDPSLTQTTDARSFVKNIAIYRCAAETVIQGSEFC